MPYVKEGGQKFTSHQITSPLNYISSTCQVCHRESEEVLRNNVYDRQKKVMELREKAEIALVGAHVEAKAAWDAGAVAPDMDPALQHIRNSQWYWDFAVAGHGNAFHSPVEVSRLLGVSISEANEARLILARVLAKRGKNEPVLYPDITTKEKAQAFIGLEMTKLKAEKAEWIRAALPGWDEKARAREAKYATQMEDKD
jgi:nitrite reductase (cytochrome c-552)